MPAAEKAVQLTLELYYIFLHNLRFLSYSLMPCHTPLLALPTEAARRSAPQPPGVHDAKGDHGSA